MFLFYRQNIKSQLTLPMEDLDALDFSNSNNLRISLDAIYKVWGNPFDSFFDFSSQYDSYVRKYKIDLAHSKKKFVSKNEGLVLKLAIN